MEDLKLDILAFGAHPDDVEMSCSGTLMSHIASGAKAGIIDLTRGELGTRGSAELRLKEADAAKKIMGVTIRENLGMRDGFFMNDEKHQLEVIKMLRKYRPDVVIANAISDRHSDHGKAAELVRDASFLSGLMKIETSFNGEKQKEWRPKAVYHYIQDKDIPPDFLIDISDFFEKKMNAIAAYQSQFHNPDSAEPVTYISAPDFLDSIKGRNRNWGKAIGAAYAEGFTVNKIIGVRNMLELS